MNGAQASVPGPLLRQALFGLAGTAAVELLLLRTFTRTAIHIPDVEVLQGPMELLAATGRFAYYVAIVLLACALPFAALALWRTRVATAGLAAIAIGGFVLAAAFAATGAGGRVALDVATLTAAALLALAAALAAPRHYALVALLFATAFVIAGLHTALQAWGIDTATGETGERALLSGEIAALAFALGTPLLIGERLRTIPLLAGAVAAVVVLGSFVAGGGSTARILLLWNGGLQGSLPVVLYPLAAAALVATAVQLARSQRLLEVAGLVLVLSGGAGLHNTYQSGLVIAGLTCLVVAAVSLKPAPEPHAETLHEPNPARQSRPATA